MTNDWTWEIIKQKMVRGERKGSVGYSLELTKAADIFVSILPNLKAEREQLEFFNKDEEVKDALLASSFLKTAGIA